MKKFVTMLLSATLMVSMLAGCNNAEKAVDAVEDKAQEVVEDVKEEVEKVVLSHENSQKWMEGKTPKKVIVVPNKIVNIVI